MHYHLCDLTNAKQIKQLVETTTDLFGGVDGLVNNAGGPPAGKFESLDDRDWEQAFNLNLLSYVRAIREVLPHMRRQGGGRIVNIASSAVKEPIDGLILSNTIRNGLVGMAKTLSVSWLRTTFSSTRWHLAGSQRIGSWSWSDSVLRRRESAISRSAAFLKQRFR